MSNDSIPMSNEDQYGQRHPIETPDLIAEKLLELESELSLIPDDKKQGWIQAQEQCDSSLVNDDFKLLFLRCEVFNADLAAKRLANYWDKRIKLFGPDKAFLPMTLDGALRDDSVALSIGFARLMPSKDPVGRSIVFVDPSKLDGTKYERESMCRALWYILHAALENPKAQQMGNIMLGYPRHAHVTQVDRSLMKMNMESLKRCIPVRISAFFLCHPPTFFAVIFPIIRLFLGERLRKRINVLTGSDQEVVEELAKYGLTKDCIPSELTGHVVLDHDSWLNDRKESSL